MFPFYGLTPAMLRAMSNPATIQANIQATINATSRQQRRAEGARPASQGACWALPPCLLPAAGAPSAHCSCTGSQACTSRAPRCLRSPPAAATAQQIGAERMGTSQPSYPLLPPHVHGEDGEDRCVMGAGGSGDGVVVRPHFDALAGSSCVLLSD